MTEALGSTGQLGADEHPRRTPGTPCWVSLLVPDLKAAEKFYGTLFGWEFRPYPNTTLVGRYVHALLDGKEVAGIGRGPVDHPVRASWTPYLACDDADVTAERVRHCGGTVGVGPLAAAAGRLAVASDPAGAVFGIWQSVAHRGIADNSAAGAPVWTELLTFDADIAVFYELVFGLRPRINPSAGPGTRELHHECGPVASVHGRGRALPRDRGAHWVTYFETADVDTAARRVTDLGGSLIEAPRDGVYGRVASVADPEGAAFALVQTPG